MKYKELSNTKLKRILDKVHWETYRSFKYVRDIDKYGKSEYWETPEEVLAGLDERDFEGDCDQFALACRAQLREEGIRNRLVFCKVTPESESGHLVCAASGYILGNRFNTVKRRDDMDYVWIKISGYEKGDKWHRITN